MGEAWSTELTATDGEPVWGDPDYEALFLEHKKEQQRRFADRVVEFLVKAAQDSYDSGARWAEFPVYLDGIGLATVRVKTDNARHNG